MAEESFTLILIPHARGECRQVQIPGRAIQWARGVGAAAAVVFGGVFVHYVWLSQQMSELESVRSDNASLVEEASRYSESIGELESRVLSLQHAVTKLGVMSGVETTQPDGGGVGGVMGVDSVPPSLDPEVTLRSLSRGLSELSKRSNRIESFYSNQRELLVRTPSVWPVHGYLSSGFGNRVDPFTGQKDFHSGIDISAPLGTKVQAPADGVVVATGARGAYGQAIILDHGHGVITRYGHLDGYSVKPGERIQRGEVIGFIGNTGRSNAPHLHYEVWVRDRAQDPIHFILDEYRSFNASS